MTKSVKVKAQPQTIRNILDKQMWKLWEYEQISDDSSKLDTRAIALGVPDGFAGRVRGGSREFKTSPS